MICEFQEQYELSKLRVYLNMWLTGEKLWIRRIPGRHLTIQRTTFRRHKTTMEVTMLKKTTTTRTRNMGRVTQLRVCSENGDRNATSTSKQKKWRGYTRTRVVYLLQCVKLEDMSSSQKKHHRVKRRHSGCTPALLEVCVGIVKILLRGYSSGHHLDWGDVG
jgi:hypothetical protein